MKDLIKSLIYILVLFFGTEALLPGSEIEYKIDALLKPVVRVDYKTSSGSGIIACSRNEKIGHRNFVLTNWHVVQDAINKNEEEETRDVVTIRTYDYRKKGRNVVECTRKARILKYSKEFDIAVLEVLERDVALSSIRLLPKKETLELFQEVWHVGFPGAEHVIFVKGIINGVNKNSSSTEIGFMPKYITTNGPIWYGSSGGLTAIEINDIYYIAGIPTLILDMDYKQGAPYINWCISAKSIRLFLDLNSLQFIYDDNAEIPKFKVYPRPPRGFDIKIDFFVPWLQEN